MLKEAKWIATPATEQAAPLFRREFQVEEGLCEARLSVCGLGYGVVTLNGCPVTEDVLTTPFTRFDATVLYQVYDVKSLLAPGCNAAGVMLGNGWYNEIASTWDYEKASWRHHPKLIFQLELIYAHGRREYIVSDSSWKTADGPCRWNHLRCGENWDARLEQPGWEQPGFDDSTWQQAFVCRTPGGQLRQAELPPIRVMETLPFKEVFPGVYDLGRNISGWARIQVQGEAGASVDLIYSERMNADGTLDRANINTFCDGTLDHRDRYTLKGGEPECWEPRFCYHGFRYVQVEGEARLLGMEGRVVHTALDIVGEFSCSDDVLNQIHQAARYSTLYNYHGIPTDCPHREQNGWTGDALLSSEQALMNYNMIAAYRKWLGDFRDVQRPSGQLPGVVPTGGWGFNWGSGPAWDSALILIPYYMWNYWNDLSAAREFWPNMERYMDFMESMSENGLVDFGLGDWCPPNNAVFCPPMLTDTAYCYADAAAMTEMAVALGKPDQRWKKLAADTKAAFRAKFMRQGKVEPESQTAYACAIYQGLLEPWELAGAAKRLNELVEEKAYHIDCGILGTKYIFRALSDFGYGETLLKMVKNPTCPSYAWWLSQGMTTLCEDWEMVNSLNHHMFSEVDFWFYRYLAGIQIEKEHITISPQFLPGLQWVRASHRDISVCWDAEAIEVTVPRAAELHLEGKTVPLQPGRNRISRKG